LASQVSDDDDEEGLGKRIGDLWFSGWLRRTTMKRNREQWQLIKTELSRDLHRYKQLLVSRGRNSGWAAFLREHEIPKATAERYVKSWEESQSPNVNRLTETIYPPTAEQIAALVKKTHPKLVKVLTTEDSRTQFVEALAAAFRGTVVVIEF